MEKSSSHDALSPAKLRSAIEGHFQARTPQDVVARAEALIPESTPCRRPDQSLAVKATEASWLLMVSHDEQSAMQAILFATNVIRELAEVNESISRSRLEPDTFSVQERRMLVPRPRIAANVLQGLVSSVKVDEMAQKLSAWADQPQLLAKQQLNEVSNAFASFAPILEENDL